jgi:hypothetical protein
VVAAGYVIAVWVFCTILGFWATLSLEGSIDLDFLTGRFALQQLGGLIRTWMITWPVIAFALFVAVWARNTGVSITLGGMAYFLDWAVLFSLFGFVITYVFLAPAVEAGLDPASVDLGIWGVLPTLSPHYNMAAVVHWGDIEMMSTDASIAVLAVLGVNLPHGPWRGLGLLLAYSFLSLALAWWTFRRKDVTV